MRAKTENEVETQKIRFSPLATHALWAREAPHTREKVSGRRFVPYKTDFEKKAQVWQS